MYRQMGRQNAVIWNLEWNGIVQECYIQYFIDDNLSDQSMKILAIWQLY
jgi:hypothetical protein